MKIKLFLTMILLSVTLSACSAQDFNKENTGTVLGALGGGVIGSKFGKGNGQLWATGAGAVLGGLAGKTIGKQLDERDQMLQNQAFEKSYSAPVGKSIKWNNPNTGNNGTVTTTREGYADDNQYCREYQQTIIVAGKKETAVGTACKNPDGSWTTQ